MSYLATILFLSAVAVLAIGLAIVVIRSNRINTITNDRDLQLELDMARHRRMLESPHLDVSTQRAILLYESLVSLQVENKLNKEVYAWCRDNISSVPKTIKSKGMNNFFIDSDTIIFHLIFETEDDAFAFKMRWM